MLSLLSVSGTFPVSIESINDAIGPIKASGIHLPSSRGECHSSPRCFERMSIVSDRSAWASGTSCRGLADSSCLFLGWREGGEILDQVMPKQRLGGEQTAIDWQDHTRNPTCFVAGQEHDRPGQVPGSTLSTQRYHAPSPVSHFGVQADRISGIQMAHCDTVSANALPPMPGCRDSGQLM